MGVTMTLLQLQVLLAVVEQRTFTKAAEVLHLTQSSVSQTIASLESELGVTLLNRSRNGITLTETGERIVTHVREIFYRTSLIQQEAASSLGLKVGTIRIGSIPSVSAMLLPGIIGTFKTKYPGIELVMFEGSYDEVKEWILSSVIDIGLITITEDELFPIPLVQDKMVIFIPANHPLSSESQLDLKQIEHEPFIMPKADCEDFIKHIFRKHNMNPNIQFEVRDTATILAMVQEGVGVTMLPEMAIPTSLPKVSSSYLKPLAYRNVGFGLKNKTTITPATDAFIDHAQEYVKELSFKLFNRYQSDLRLE